MYDLSLFFKQGRMIMNNALIAKVMGWGQFALNSLGTVATVGIPTNPMAWISLIGSLIMAVGTHAAAATDGVK